MNNSQEKISVPTMAQYATQGKRPEILFWVGCAGSFDDRSKKITKAFVRLLNQADIDFAVLGVQESCCGDPAKRAGNEYLFQMQAMINIKTLNGYGVTKIVTACPHGFNTLKNEYPELGGHFEVVHHTQFLRSLIAEGRLKVDAGKFKGKRITFHDPCYLGRGNGEYEAPRNLLQKLEVELVEMKRSRTRGFCCGAGGAQFFKEPEPGDKYINVERAEEAIGIRPKIIATGCPYCANMLTDGIKVKNKEGEVQVMDIAEMIANATDL